MRMRAAAFGFNLDQSLTAVEGMACRRRKAGSAALSQNFKAQIVSPGQAQDGPPPDLVVPDVIGSDKGIRTLRKLAEKVDPLGLKLEWRAKYTHNEEINWVL